MHDLCTLILNNLTLMQRKTFSNKGKVETSEPTLAVEHKLFFNEYYRTDYD